MMIVVIPALNEENTISSVIEKASNHFPVLVVDDGSVDRTGEVAAASGARVIRLDENKGVDFALAQGFKAALESGFDAVLTIDADGQHDPELIPLIAHSVVSGESDICHSDRDTFQRWSEKLLRAYSSRVHGYGDILSGLKAFKLKIYSENPTLVEKDTLGTAVPWLAKQYGYTISQVKISTTPRKDKPRIGGVLLGNYRVCKALLRLIKWDFIGVKLY